MAVMLVCSLRTVLSDERDAAVRGGMADDEIRRRLLVAGRNQAKKGVRAARKGKKKRRKKELRPLHVLEDENDLFHLYEQCRARLPAPGADHRQDGQTQVPDQGTCDQATTVLYVKIFFLRFKDFYFKGSRSSYDST
jgi:hypothetical protein